MRPIRLCKLEEQHIKGILEIERMSQPAPWSEASFRNEIGHPGGLFLVAESDGVVVAYCACWLVVDEAHIITIAVHPDYRREGIGSKIVTETLLQSRERGASCATLEVRVSNSSAIELYLRLGFSKCGRRKNYYPNDREDAEVMWLRDLAGWEPPLPPKAQ